MNKRRMKINYPALIVGLMNFAASILKLSDFFNGDKSFSNLLIIVGCFLMGLLLTFIAFSWRKNE